MGSGLVKTRESEIITQSVRQGFKSRDRVRSEIANIDHIDILKSTNVPSMLTGYGIEAWKTITGELGQKVGWLRETDRTSLTRLCQILHISYNLNEEIIHLTNMLLDKKTGVDREQVLKEIKALTVVQGTNIKEALVIERDFGLTPKARIEAGLINVKGMQAEIELASKATPKKQTTKDYITSRDI